MNEILNSEMNQFGINRFLEASNQYTNKLFPNMELDKLFSATLTGDFVRLLKNNIVAKVFLSEIKSSTEILSSIIIIIIIHTIFKTIVDGLKNAESGKIVYFVQYLLIVTIIIQSFIPILELTRDTINDVTNFINLLIPLLITLMLTTGSIVTTNIFQPVLIFLSSFIGNFVEDFVIPILLISIVLSIVSNISEKVQVDKLSKSLKTFIIWSLGIALTLFTCVLSLEGTLSSNVDGITAKTAKSAVSSLIPVFGKIMGDTVDSVIGCSNILKNSIGIVGIIVIISIIALPTMKILIMWLSFKITSAICEPVADVRIVKLMEQIADGYKVLLAILLSISMIFIISITLVMKITNSVLMYR